ncbi:MULTISPECIES: hypothetical protein [unclassified Sphingomonas]|uniref:hypothetical protein n=1 Tax=unclassified Sphingomonas TaxID=196159 RepID=UPI0012E11ABD|nr:MULTISPECIES: hypothetical protein [unclassified Sphingomonas]
MKISPRHGHLPMLLRTNPSLRNILAQPSVANGHTIVTPPLPRCNIGFVAESRLRH